MQFKYNADNTVSTYKYVCSYTFNNETVTVYTDNSILFQDMVTNNDEFSNFISKEITLTQEQQDRLNDYNSKSSSNSSAGYGEYVSKFIIDGYVSKDAPEYLQEFLKEEKYQDQSRSYILEQITQYLKDKRKVREDGGVRFKEYTASTDEKSRLTITALIVSVGQGLITQVDYKFEDGFATLNQQEIMELSKLMLAHNQLCFTAEKLCNEKLLTLTLQELQNYETKYQVNDLYDETYRALYLELLKK